MKWKERLTDQERDRMAEIADMRRSFTEEIRRIYDRCRKRMANATKAERENGRENDF